MDFEAESLNLGCGKRCMRGAVNSKLQRAYDTAVRSGSVAELNRVREEIRHAAPEDIFTLEWSDVELLHEAAEVMAARAGLPRRAEGAANMPIAPRESAKSIQVPVERNSHPPIMAVDAALRHRFPPT